MEENPDPTPKLQPKAMSMAPEAGARRGRVLVAEDSALIRIVTVATLALIGYDADVVADGRQAVEAVARNDYLAVFMDCQMPKMDGYQATAEIRRLEAGRRHTPIIALTASPVQDSRQACLAAGMDDHLSKPARKEELAAALQRWRGPMF